MTRLVLKLVPDIGRNDLTYFSGKLNAVLTLDKSLSLSKDYSFSVHTDTLHTLCYAAHDFKHVERRGHAFKVDFGDSQIWLPGTYFLLFRSGDTILRFDFRYDEQGVFIETSSRQCLKLSDEDILSGTLASKRHWRVWFSSTPGAAQLKRWIIGRLQERAFNAVRSEYHRFSLDYSNSLFLIADSVDYTGRSLLLMRFLADIKSPNTSVDCNTLFSSASDPFYKLDEIFQEDETEFLPDVTLPSSKEHIYSFRNISALLEPGRESVLRRILAHCPSTTHPAVFCGTQQEISRLLELAPSLQGYIPQCNRLTMEPYTANEKIRVFFHELDLAKLTLTPESVDAACHLFYERHQQDADSYGSLMAIRDYVNSRILPAYRRRAITAIQQGISPAEVLDLQPEDLSSYSSFMPAASYH